MRTIKETTLHPDGNDGVDLYPKTNINQVEGLKEKIEIYDNYQERIINLETGKLNKPTKPSAESAVTMLADGTVGTKLLSEIGGGGKLYRHDFTVSDGTHQSTATSKFSLYSSTRKTYTLSDLKNLYDYTPIIGNTTDGGNTYINLLASNEPEDPNWYITYARINTDTGINSMLKVTEILSQVTTEV